MSITPVILVILTFIVNFIMDFSFWSVMLSLYYLGGAPAGTDDVTLLVSGFSSIPKAGGRPMAKTDAFWKKDLKTSANGEIWFLRTTASM